MTFGNISNMQVENYFYNSFDLTKEINEVK